MPNLSIVQITPDQKSVYDDIIRDEKGAWITQGSSWAVLQQRTGRHVHLFVVVNETKEVLGSCLLVRQPLPLGKCYLYAQRGPIMKPEESEVFDMIMTEIDRLAEHHKAIYVRLEPGWILSEESSNDRVKDPLISYGHNIDKNYLLDRGFVPAHASHQPEITLVLDLTKPLDQLFSEMKPKGRYNIRIAEKKNVIVSTSKDILLDSKAFYRLLKNTAKRDKYFVHPYIYYKNFLETLSAKNQAHLYLAHIGNELIAANIVTWYGDKAVYYYGASSNKYRNTMATYLIQWQVIKDAKNAGLKFYDFLGIAPRGKPHHPWLGITSFKEKFGGTRVNYLPAAEKIYFPKWYKAMLTTKKTYKVIRRLTSR